MCVCVFFARLSSSRCVPKGVVVAASASGESGLDRCGFSFRRKNSSTFAAVKCLYGVAEAGQVGSADGRGFLSIFRRNRLPAKMRDTSPSGTVLRSDRFAGKELSEALEMFVEGGARREGDRKCFVDKVDEQYEGKNICHFTVAAIS